MKKTVIAACVVLAVVIIAALILPSLVNLDRHKGSIISRIKSATGRDVDFTHISLTVLTGIGAEIENLRIAENPLYAQGDFVTVKGIEIRVEVLPLLKKQIKIKKIIVKEPSLVITRNSAGEFNFSDLMKKKGGAPGKTSGTVTPSLPSFLVRKLQITNGNILYKDEKLFPGREFNLQELNVDIGNLSLVEPVSMTVEGRITGGSSSASGPKDTIAAAIKSRMGLEYSREHLSIESFEIKVNDGKITLQGEVDNLLRNQKWNMKATADSINPMSLTALLPGVVKLPKELSMEGPLSAVVSTSGTREGFTLSSDVLLDAMKISYGNAFTKPAGTKLALAVKSDIQGDTFTLQSIELSLNTITARANGTIVLEKPSPRVAINVGAFVVPLEGLRGMTDALEPYTPSGSIKGDVTVTGVTRDLVINVRGASDSIGFTLPPPQDAKETVKGKTGTLSGLKTALSFRKTEKLTGGGEVSISHGVFSGLPFDKLIMKFNYTPEKVDVSELSMNTFGGSVKTTASYGMAEKDWNVKTSLAAIDVNKVLSATTAYKDTFTGTLGGTVDVRGSAAKGGGKPLAAEGSLSIVKGEWKNFNLVDTVLGSLFGIQGMSGLITSFGGETARHESTRFDSLDAAFILKGKQLQISEAVLKNIQTSKATDSTARIDGSVDLEAKTLDLAGKVILSAGHSEKLAGKAEVLRALLNNEKQMVLPVTIKGTVGKPIPFLDTAYVTKAVSQYYIQKNIGKSLEKIQKKLGVPGKGNAAGSGVQKLLDGIFRKK
ncbi:MAG: AsmA family protein [Deltaproteobacteria bacterium]|nr:AsmA family protein [Deltaproteobacteria bacterium]